MKSTNPNGSLRLIEKCYLRIPGLSGSAFPDGKIICDNIPDITDSKNAVYAEEVIIGRSSPMHTYSYSSTRQISVNFHFYITKAGDARKNLQAYRAISSCVYTRDDESDGGAPYIPPPICQFRCGNLLAEEEELCVVLQNYSFNPDPSVPWDEETFCPYRFDVATSWWVVYPSEDLPTQKRILRSGR